MTAWTGWFFKQEDGEPPSNVARWQWPNSTLVEIWKEPGEWMAMPIFMEVQEETSWVPCSQEAAEEWLRDCKFPPQ